MVLFSLLQWLSHGSQLTAHITEAVWVSVQKHLHGLLILNHLHCPFFLLKFYIQVYYPLSVWEHLTVTYQGSSKAVSEYLEMWITALFIENKWPCPRWMSTGIELGSHRGSSGCVGGLRSLLHWKEQELSMEEEITIFIFLFLSFSTGRLTCDWTDTFHSELFKGCSFRIINLAGIFAFFSLLCWMLSEQQLVVVHVSLKLQS